MGKIGEVSSIDSGVGLRSGRKTGAAGGFGWESEFFEPSRSGKGVEVGILDMVNNFEISMRQKFVIEKKL